MAEEVRKVIHIDTQGSQTSVKDLRDNVKKLQDALLGLDSASEEYKQIATQIYSTQQKLNQVMSAGKNAITPYERSLKALTDTYANQRQELRALRTALENLDPSSREYQVAFERAADITHELQERQEMLRRSSSDLGVQLSNMQQIGTGIAAGFSAVNAMMVLTGNHSEDLQKVMVKLQAGMALVQGMKGLDGLTKAVQGYVKGAAKWFDSIKNTISGNKNLATTTQTVAAAENSAAAGAATETAALKVQTTATVGATAAATALKAVLMSLGIGVAVAAITGLISLIGKWIDKTKEGYKAVELQAKNYFDVNEKSWEHVETMHQREIESLRAKGATEREINEANLAYHKALLNKYEEEYQALLNVQSVQNKMGSKKIGNKARSTTITDLPETMNNIPKIENSIKHLMETTTVDMSKWSTAHINAFDKIKNQGIKTYEDLKNAFWIYRKLIEQWNNDLRFNEIETDEQAQENLKNQTIKNAEDRNRSEIKVLKDSKAEELRIVGDNATAKTNIENYYSKQIWSIITGQTQGIIDNAKAANQTELENLEDKYNKELKILKQYGRSTVELTKAYQKQREEILYKNTTTAITEYMRVAKNQVKELTKDSKFEEQRLQALGLPSADAAQKRADEIYEYELQLANEELKLWKQVSDKYEKEIDERREKEGEAFVETEGEIQRRAEIEQKISDLVLKIHETENNKIIEDAKIRTQRIKEQLAELDKEIDKIEAGTRGKLANSRYNYDINSLPNNFWQNAAGTANPTFAAQKAQVEEEYKIVVEGLRKQIEAKKKFAEENKLIGDEKIKNDKEIAALEAQIMQATNEAVIQQSEIQQEAWQTILDATLSVADSFADVLGSIADTMESQIERQKEAGEITEEEAEKQMDQVRAIQIAQAIINTLSGSIGAFTQASATIPPPAGQIVGAAAAAAVIAAGVAQIAQIKNTKKGSSNITSGLKAAAPALTDYTPDYQANLTGNSEMSQLRNALDGTEIRAYVVESDITEAQRRQNRRSSESTF